MLCSKKVSIKVNILLLYCDPQLSVSYHKGLCLSSVCVYLISYTDNNKRKMTRKFIRQNLPFVITLTH